MCSRQAGGAHARGGEVDKGAEAEHDGGGGGGERPGDAEEATGLRAV